MMVRTMKENQDLKKTVSNVLGVEMNPKKQEPPSRTCLPLGHVVSATTVTATDVGSRLQRFITPQHGAQQHVFRSQLPTLFSVSQLLDYSEQIQGPSHRHTGCISGSPALTATRSSTPVPRLDTPVGDVLSDVSVSINSSLGQHLNPEETEVKIILISKMEQDPQDPQ